MDRFTLWFAYMSASCERRSMAASSFSLSCFSVARRSLTTAVWSTGAATRRSERSGAFRELRPSRTGAASSPDDHAAASRPPTRARVSGKRSSLKNVLSSAVRETENVTRSTVDVVRRKKAATSNSATSQHCLGSMQIAAAGPAGDADDHGTPAWSVSSDVAPDTSTSKCLIIASPFPPSHRTLESSSQNGRRSPVCESTSARWSGSSYFRGSSNATSRPPRLAPPAERT
mmetsp:Transcript_22707/g.68026  ORF Transcript_22707/g.68026 Transcript_22707/m.68026 type:complete len:230 (-) Transcript_22707:1158-1847(-)